MSPAPPPLTLEGGDPARKITFPTGMLLAPMDGITDALFRGMVLALGDAGGACTEFVRISAAPVPRKVFARELGTGPRTAQPVGVQIMAPDDQFIEESVSAALAAGAVWIDLNFGCPVKRVFNKCAGSALLAHPERMARIVASTVGAAGGIPVTAKIRAGVEDESPLDEVLDACAEAGAAAVTLHARLRRHSYAEPATWEWIARAAARLHARPRPLPLIGNGGVDRADDVARMLRETGCDAVMIGRAAFADPWIFREARGGEPATRDEAVAFARAYLDALCPPGGPIGGLCQFKRLVASFRAGGVFDAASRAALLRAHDPAVHRAWLDRAPEPAAA